LTPRQVFSFCVSDVTQILNAIEAGDTKAAADLLPLVYTELRKLAAAQMARESPGQTLQATGLVHEAYLRLVGENRTDRWNGRGHFFAAAAEAMRRILIDRVRGKKSQRRGGELRRHDLLECDRIDLPLNDEIVDLDEALTKFSVVDPQAAEIVKMRVFAGMTINEVADVQGISARTATRNWAYARAWLGRELAAYDNRQT
jgi:RNA polymerase sigma factor (TIGR02999 family)